MVNMAVMIIVTGEVGGDDDADCNCSCFVVMIVVTVEGDRS